jgi:hypothetical protein
MENVGLPARTKNNPAVKAKMGPPNLIKPYILFHSFPRRKHDLLNPFPDLARKIEVTFFYQDGILSNFTHGSINFAHFYAFFKDV